MVATQEKKKEKEGKNGFGSWEKKRRKKEKKRKEKKRKGGEENKMNGLETSTYIQRRVLNYELPKLPLY